MKIVVTGGSGFIGKHVVDALRLRGHTVLNVSRQGEIKCDLFDETSIATFFERAKPEGLIHLAWVTEHGKYWNSSDNLRWVECSLKLLQQFQRNGGKRAVFAGSSAEYDWRTEKPLVEKTSPLSNDSLYAESKNRLRHSAELFVEDCEMSLAWARFFCPFGPGEDHRRLIPKIVEQLNRGVEIPFDSGNLIRDFMYVEDVASATIALFESESIGPVNICSGFGISIRELLTTIGSAMGKKILLKFDELPDPENQPLMVVGSAEKLKNEAGWSIEKVRLKEKILDFCALQHQF